MKTLPVVIALVLLSGCTEEPGQKIGTDQCLRAELFKSCMAAIPQGPQSITASSNDWAEVVEECGQIAYYQSRRIESQSTPACFYPH